MPKPVRIKHSAVGVKANDHQLHRLQAIGFTSALNPEEIKEIGNDSIVEVADGVPTVDITLDRNQDGSMKTLALFANKCFNYGYVQVTPSGGMTVNISNDEYFIDECRYVFSGGTATLAAPSSNNCIVVLSLTKNGTLAITSGTSGVNPTPPTTPTSNLKIAEIYLSSGQTTIENKHILNCHDYITITEKDFENASVDVIVGVKESGDASTTTDYITRTAYMENAFLSRLEFACNTGGASTENMSAETDNRRWFLGNKRTIVDARAVGSGTTKTLSSMTVQKELGSTPDPVQLKNGKYFLKVYLYDSTTGKYTTLKEVTTVSANDEFSYNSGTKTLTFNYSIPNTTTIIARYAANVDLWCVFKKLPKPDKSHPDLPAVLNQGQIEVYLSLLPPEQFSPSSSSMTLRVESCSVSLGLTRTALNEIGHHLPYSRPLQMPIPVTVNLNTTASDLEELAKLCGISLSSATELQLDDFIKNLYLYIYMYRENDVKRQEAPYKWQPYLKKIVLTDLSVTNDAFDLRVDANATQNWTLTCDNITVTGCR